MNGFTVQIKKNQKWTTEAAGSILQVQRFTSSLVTFMHISILTEMEICNIYDRFPKNNKSLLPCDFWQSDGRQFCLLVLLALFWQYTCAVRTMLVGFLNNVISHCCDIPPSAVLRKHKTALLKSPNSMSENECRGRAWRPQTRCPWSSHNASSLA